ncbi:hypothetical protein EYC80_005902 [Monilinia laxa]|uniref:Uncharacterized protein n=1 Tax=Monilinia laxa TaxID=61186 RepID=A0A5N6KFF3_MONLA|nr:hypothetical protein EYC80_005902 [Monilinia laxa]
MPMYKHRLFMRPRSSLFLFPFFYTCNPTALLPSLLASLLLLASFSYSGLYPQKLKSLDSLFFYIGVSRLVRARLQMYSSSITLICRPVFSFLVIYALLLCIAPMFCAIAYAMMITYPTNINLGSLDLSGPQTQQQDNGYNAGYPQHQQQPSAGQNTNAGFSNQAPYA